MTAPVFVHDGCLDPRACAAVRRAMDAAPQSAAEIFQGSYRVDEQVRRSNEVEADAATLSMVQAAIEALAPGLSRHFGVALSGCEGVGLLRYLPGGFYRRHRDVLPVSSGVADRRVSLVLFLGGTARNKTSIRDGECVGGALRVFADALSESYTDFLPHEGRLVAFPAHLLHEVLPVSAGVRDVAVDWGVGASEF